MWGLYAFVRLACSSSLALRLSTQVLSELYTRILEVVLQELGQTLLSMNFHLKEPKQGREK